MIETPVELLLNIKVVPIRGFLLVAKGNQHLAVLIEVLCT